MNKMKLLGVTICMVSNYAMALDQGDYVFNGFGTAAVSRIGGVGDAKSYGFEGRTTDSWRGDQLSRLAGQLSYGLTDKLSATVQTVAKTQQDTWKLKLESAYLAYEANDQLTFRAGRLRPGVYMFSETLDVGYSYPWLRLPDEVYSQFPVSSFEGGDVLYKIPTPLGSLDLQFQYGQATDRKVYINQVDDEWDLDIKEMVDAAIALNTDSFGTFRYGYSEGNVSVNGSAPAKGKFTSIGHRYDNGTIVTNAEAIKRRASGSGGNTKAFYVMAGYRVGDFLPHVTYAQTDVTNEGRQSSWAYGLNYSLTPTVTLKGEYKRVDSTKGQSGVFTPDYTAARSTYDGDVISVGFDFIF